MYVRACTMYKLNKHGTNIYMYMYMYIHVYLYVHTNCINIMLCKQHNIYMVYMSKLQCAYANASQTVHLHTLYIVKVNLSIYNNYVHVHIRTVHVFMQVKFSGKGKESG